MVTSAWSHGIKQQEYLDYCIRLNCHLTTWVSYETTVGVAWSLYRSFTFFESEGHHSRIIYSNHFRSFALFHYSIFSPTPTLCHSSPFLTRSYLFVPHIFLKHFFSIVSCLISISLPQTQNFCIQKRCRHHHCFKQLPLHDKRYIPHISHFLHWHKK